MSNELNTLQESFNNLTWDVNLNLASMWLFMRDIESASLNVKSSIYSWNVNLTADFYKQISKISEKKYALVSPDWTLSWNYYERYLTENWELADYTMLWKDPWLYMDHERMWFWGWDVEWWMAYIWNNWEFFFKWDANNYIEWNWTTLHIEWNIIARDWYFYWDITSEAIITWWTIQTANTWRRIIIDDVYWFRAIDPSNNVKIHIPISWADADRINFFWWVWEQTSIQWATLVDTINSINYYWLYCDLSLQVKNNLNIDLWWLVLNTWSVQIKDTSSYFFWTSMRLNVIWTNLYFFDWTTNNLII
jgi:hypothetical protein